MPKRQRRSRKAANTNQQNEKPDAMWYLDKARDIIVGTLTDVEIAKDTGFSTGVNISTIVNMGRRILQGKASLRETVATALNAAHVIGGAIIGHETFKEMEKAFDSKESVKEKAKQKIKEEVDENA